jgi:cytochrome c peroxidase
MKAPEVTAALAAYVRSIRCGDSRFDRYAAGQVKALTDLEKAGLAVFRGKGHCNACLVARTSPTRNFTILECRGRMDGWPSPTSNRWRQN